jgi:outer membrane protein TolC
MNNKCYIAIQTLIIFFISSNFFVNCETLSRDKYIDTVLKNNKKIISINFNIESTKLKIDEIKNTKYQFLLNLKTEKDSLYESDNNIHSLFDITKTLTTSTEVSLGYDFSTFKSFFNLRQSLLRKPFVTKMDILCEKSKLQSLLYSLEYEKQNILLDASIAYLEISYLNEVENITKKSLERKNKIFELNRNKYNKNLIDKSDLLESKIAVKNAELDLIKFYSKKNKAINNLCNFLNIDETSIKNYEFDSIFKNIEKLKNENKLYKNGIKKNVLSVIEDVNFATYNQKKNNKILDGDLIFDWNIKYKLLNRNNLKKDDFSRSIKLTYEIPLNFKLKKNIKLSYAFLKKSSEELKNKIILTENNDWTKLLNDWDNAIKNLKNSIEIEKMQYEKYKEDKKLLSFGKKDTFYILQSEQNFINSSVAIIDSIKELIEIQEKVNFLYNN